MNTVMKSLIIASRFLRMFGMGAAAIALGSVAATDQVFAKQFVSNGTAVNLPPMIYDPKTQMMVDPTSRMPIYEDAKKLQLALPTVTSGCGDCPKKDDDGSD